MSAPAPEEQREYYARRMTEELARAEQAESDGLRHLHFSWASQYRRRLEALAGSGAAPRHQAEARGLGSWTTDLG
jgi:hypothetical protein